MVGHTPHPTAAEPTGRWNTLWSGLFYALLIFATFNALASGSHSVLRIGLIVVLTVVLATWHLLWRIPGRAPGNRAYFVAAAVLWAGLMLADPDFLILSLGIFAPLCFHDVRWGTVALIGTGGIWLWLEQMERGGIPWGMVLAVALFVAAGLLLVAYFATVVRQSRERQQLIDQLQKTQADLAEAERQAGVLSERQRLAREIHDTLTQGLASIVMLLEAASASWPSAVSGQRHVDRALQTARDNLAESRRVVWAMHPAALADASLAEALRRLTSELSEDVGIETELKVTGTPLSLVVDEEAAVLRVAQEALSNIRKHAEATTVTVTLSYMDDAVALDVQDNGVGFPSHERRSRGAGLGTMRERAETLGGTLTVESGPAEGTIVAFEFPLREHEPLTAPAHRP
jgi:signal transduction histidine kinase